MQRLSFLLLLFLLAFSAPFASIIFYKCNTYLRLTVLVLVVRANKKESWVQLSFLLVRMTGLVRNDRRERRNSEETTFVSLTPRRASVFRTIPIYRTEAAQRQRGAKKQTRKLVCFLRPYCKPPIGADDRGFRFAKRKCKDGLFFCCYSCLHFLHRSPP